MITPESKLLWATALIVSPVALLGAVIPATGTVAIVLILLFVALALLDAALSSGTLDGISIELPRIVRLSKDRLGAVCIHIKNERQAARRLRLGLPFPREIQTETEDLATLLPPGSLLSQLSWPCTPNQRGNFVIDKCYLETTSPWGFWSVRAACPVQSEIRVYPNLMDERRAVGALFLNRGHLGMHMQRQVGRGREFEKLREYSPGDGYDEIHWKATAKRGRPITKVFQIERTQEVYVILDASRLSGRKQTSRREGERATAHRPHPAPAASHIDGVPALERFVNAALVLGLAAEQQGDLFGLMTFSDRVQSFVRAKNGKAHYTACRDALYTLQPQIVSPDFDEVCSFIRLRLRRRALLVFLTALDDPVLAESFVRNMDLICRQHLVFVNMFQPAGVAPLFANPQVGSLDDIYQQLGGHARWHDLRELEKTLQHRGVRFSLLENEKMSAQLVTQYLEVKQRQLL